MSLRRGFYLSFVLPSLWEYVLLVISIEKYLSLVSIQIIGLCICKITINWKKNFICEFILFYFIVFSKVLNFISNFRPHLIVNLGTYYKNLYCNGLSPKSNFIILFIIFWCNNHHHICSKFKKKIQTRRIKIIHCFIIHVLKTNPKFIKMLNAFMIVVGHWKISA